MQNDRTLILGGTVEARLLAESWPHDRDVIVSYSGIYGKPPVLPLQVRVGGFGGQEGLQKYLLENHITRIIDATHPFAKQMTKHAIRATQELDIEYIRLERSPWPQHEQDQWQSVLSLEEAVFALEKYNGSIFITTGIKDLTPFQRLEDKNLIIRCLETTDTTKIPPLFRVISSSPPYKLEDEIRIMEELNVEVMVTKNSGGFQTYAKIEAARKLSIPVIMIERPVFEDIKTFKKVSELLNGLKWEA